MDKNSKAAKLPQPVSTYLKRMYTDTVSPHREGMQFRDRLLRHRQRDVRHGLSVLGSGAVPQAAGRRAAHEATSRSCLFERAPHSRLKDPAPAKTAAKREPALACRFIYKCSGAKARSAEHTLSATTFAENNLVGTLRFAHLQRLK